MPSFLNQLNILSKPKNAKTNSNPYPFFYVDGMYLFFLKYDNFVLSSKQSDNDLNQLHIQRRTDFRILFTNNKPAFIANILKVRYNISIELGSVPWNSKSSFKTASKKLSFSPKLFKITLTSFAKIFFFFHIFYNINYIPPAKPCPGSNNSLTVSFVFCIDYLNFSFQQHYHMMMKRCGILGSDHSKIL